MVEQTYWKRMPFFFSFFFFPLGNFACNCDRPNKYAGPNSILENLQSRNLTNLNVPKGFWSIGLIAIASNEPIMWNIEDRPFWSVFKVRAWKGWIKYRLVPCERLGGIAQRQGILTIVLFDRRCEWCCKDLMPIENSHIGSPWNLECARGRWSMTKDLSYFRWHHGYIHKLAEERVELENER